MHLKPLALSLQMNDLHDLQRLGRVHLDNSCHFIGLYEHSIRGNPSQTSPICLIEAP